MCSCSTHHCTAHQSIPGETTLGGESLSVVTPGSISTPEPSIGENQNKDENTDKNFIVQLGPSPKQKLWTKAEH